jgi:hypothetical protein
MAEVFVSYPHEAAKTALQLANGIRAKGIDTWCAKDNLPPGDDWKRSIITALKDAHAVIFVVSPGSQPSPWIQEEQMAALESYWAGKKKVFIPVLIGDADPPAFLRQWRALRIEKKSDLSRTVNQIIKLLHSKAKPQAEITRKVKQERDDRFREIEAVMVRRVLTR